MLIATLLNLTRLFIMNVYYNNCLQSNKSFSYTLKATFKSMFDSGQELTKK